MKRSTPILTAVLLLSALVITPRSVRAEGYAGYAGTFLRMGSGAVALATGDAGVGRAMGAEQAHYNPAGLPFAPGNDVYVGYQILSLDRSLANVGALFQIPEISYWSGPIHNLVGRKSKETGGLPYIVNAGRLSKSGDVALKISDYLDPLADAVLEEAGRAESDSAKREPAHLVIDGRTYEAGVLQTLIVDNAREARRLGLQNREAVLDLLAKRYRKVQKKPAAIALTWTHAATDNIQARDYDGVQYATLGFYENRFALSFGLKFHRKLSVGVTVGVLYALIPDMLENSSKPLTSTTFGADAGVQFRPFLGSHAPWRLQTLSLGAAAYDLGGRYAWNTTGYWSLGTTKTDRFPRRYRAGFAYEPLAGVHTYFDVETDLENLLQPKGGLEVDLLRASGLGVGKAAGTTDNQLSGVSGTASLRGQTRLALRAGIDRNRPTFGLGLTLRLAGIGVTRLDYAYVIEPVSPEATQVISWRFRFAL